MTTHLLLSQAINVFLIARQADSYSPSTLAQYKWALDILVRQGDKELDQVTTNDIRSFLAYLQTSYEPKRMGGNKAPLGTASLFAAWKAVRAFYKWACPEFDIPNPAAKIPQPRHMSPAIVPFTQEEIKTLIKACESTKPATTDRRKSFQMRRATGPRDKAIVLTLLDTGLRASELCRLDRGDCNLQAGEIVVKPVGAGIKSRSRVIPIGATCRKAIALYLARLENVTDKMPLFQKEHGGQMNRGNLLHVIYALGERTGIRDVHPHRFRHTFAIQFLRNGGNVFTLQRILGHTTLEMTRHYLALAEMDDTNAHRRASPADNWKL